MTQPTGLRVHVDAGACPDATASLLERAIRHTLEAERRADAEVSLALLADAEMRELNLRYLGKDHPTDVLAFSLGDGDDVVGDVYVGLEQATRQAAELGIPLEEELVRLAVHGTLHVLGHDHPEGPEREQSPMFQAQERLVRELFAAAHTRARSLLR
ncbi:MAG: rRNA maturation RNase YbeY [Gemmatimonadetes bacterium]|nr:rRNA maturation RNase YbeY [Gemmatimonadota bacterium]